MKQRQTKFQRIYEAGLWDFTFCSGDDFFKFVDHKKFEQNPPSWSNLCVHSVSQVQFKSQFTSVFMTVKSQAVDVMDLTSKIRLVILSYEWEQIFGFKTFDIEIIICTSLILVLNCLSWTTLRRCKYERNKCNNQLVGRLIAGRTLWEQLHRKKYVSEKRGCS